jgi:hypothetical protein
MSAFKSSMEKKQFLLFKKTTPASKLSLSGSASASADGNWKLILWEGVTVCVLHKLAPARL